MRDLLSSLDNARPEDLLDALDSAARQANEDDTEEIPPIDDSALPDEVTTSEAPLDGCKFKPINVPEDMEMRSIVLKMSTGQRVAFDLIIGYLKDLVMYNNCKWKPKPENSPKPPHLKIHGK
jgi:hypothetical protein